MKETLKKISDVCKIIFGYGIEIVDRVPIVVPANAHDARYLATKKDKMGHLI